jgi:hypothetical protein
LEFHGARVSSDAGLFPFRDLDEAAQLTESSAAELFAFRTGSNIRHGMTALLRQSIYGCLAGYEDVNDAERLRVDPVMRHVVGGRAVDRHAASTSQVARFETDVLCHPDNLAALMNMPGRWVDWMRQRRPLRKLILDMDSSVSPTYGHQEGTAYNGRFGCECYHPLFLFNQEGDIERVLLRRGPERVYAELTRGEKLEDVCRFCLCLYLKVVGKIYKGRVCCIAGAEAERLM